MKITILGSGIIGVTTAYYLAKNGHQVVVIDRQSESAAECSFANGGQLSYSHVEPWASPQVLPKIIKWLGRKHSPLVFRPRLDPKMWAWLVRFLLSCNEEKALSSTKNMMRLSLYSRKCLNEIESETGIAYTGLKKGTLHIFKDHESLNANIKQARFQKELGCDFEILPDRQACIAKEPALLNSPKPIIGGIFFPIDESGDVHEFAVNLAKLEAEKNTTFHYNTTVQKLLTEGNRITGVQTDRGVFESDAYIVSLGAYSPLLLKQIGIGVPIYPMKGYSISIPIKNPAAVPETSITDQANKIVYSRLGNILRVAGTAEFAGYDHSIRKERIDTLKYMTKCLFPDCGDIDNASEWSCLRPSTPDGSPIIGKSPYENLFMNTGQGTLGWTLSCGSAKILADIIDGKEPEIDLSGLTIDRFI